MRTTILEARPHGQSASVVWLCHEVSESMVKQYRTVPSWETTDDKRHATAIIAQSRRGDDRLMERSSVFLPPPSHHIERTLISCCSQPVIYQMYVPQTHNVHRRRKFQYKTTYRRIARRPQVICKLLPPVNNAR